jgi:hypothetical protein
LAGGRSFLRARWYGPEIRRMKGWEDGKGTACYNGESCTHEDRRVPENGGVDPRVVRETDRQIETQTYRQADRQAGRQADRQTDR